MIATSNIDPGKIKHILFDLGGVLLNIDYDLTESAFKALGLKDFEEIYTQSAQEGLFDDFEKGLLSKEEFIDKVSVKFDSNPGNDAIEKAWNAMLLDFPSERIEMLKTLRNTYNLFLLSNTNEIQFNAFKSIFAESHDMQFDSLFNRTYFSHLINMRKPDPEIFQYVIDGQRLNKTELLFIDDSEQHIVSASQLGINTVFVEKGDDIIQLLSRIGILA